MMILLFLQSNNKDTVNILPLRLGPVGSSILYRFQLEAHALWQYQS